MACWDSPNITPGQTWSGYHCNVTLVNILSGTRADIVIMPSQGKPDRFVAIEDLTYNFPDEAHPFSFVMPTCILGTITSGVIKCRTCDLDKPPDEPPSDLLGLISYISNKVIQLLTTVSSMVISLTDIGGIIALVQIRVDEAKNLIGGIQSNINYELDVLEIWISGQLNTVVDRIISPLELHKRDILETISTIQTFDPGVIIADIKAEIVQLSNTLSRKILDDLWGYIEDQLFDKKE